MSVKGNYTRDSTDL